MDPPNKNTSSKSKLKKAGKTKVTPRTESLLKRQSWSPHHTSVLRVADAYRVNTRRETLAGNTHLACQAHEDGNSVGVQIGPSHRKSPFSEIHTILLGTTSHREGFPLVSQSFQAWLYLARCLLSRDNRTPCAPSNPRVSAGSLLRIVSKSRVGTLSDWRTRLRGVIIHA